MSVEMLSIANRQSKRWRRGFSLVELLIVIGILALLISILLPSLARARAQGRMVKCLSNQRQIGIAFQLYTADHKGWYPVHSHWGNCLGKKGETEYYDYPGPTGFEGEEGIIGERPLNRYLTGPEIAECPADIGDPYQVGIETAYRAYGTSYLTAFGINCFGTQVVTGKGDPGYVPPMRVGMLGDMTRKIVLGDWNWHPNRALTAPQTLWHTKGGTERKMNMLFADGHAELFTFPPEYEQAPLNNSIHWYPGAPPTEVKPDASRGYW
jgi:prepilin-type N-terminal cleavage/methylation domain-containing protein/prepilin-type processing-associated H-X9-DG protein